MSPVTAARPPVAPQPTAAPGSLLRAEVLRLRSRRMVQMLLALAFLGVLASVGVASTQFAKPSAAGLADAAHRRELVVVEQRRVHDACLAAVGADQGEQAERCGPVLTADELGPVEDFVVKRPFELGRDGSAGVLGVAAASAVIAFLIGATYVGADWSSRSMVALLFWEPRRAKVMRTKVVVLAAAAGLLGLVAEVGWLLASRLFATTRGTSTVPAGTWGPLVTSASRGVVLVVLAGLLGFGVANVFRSTAAALGVGFVYFAVLETVVRVVRPTWQRWLITDNAVALLRRGGRTIVTNDASTNTQGVSEPSGHAIVSNLHGGLLIAVVATVLTAAGILLFVRRDVE